MLVKGMKNEMKEKAEILKLKSSSIAVSPEKKIKVKDSLLELSVREKSEIKKLVDEEIGLKSSAKNKNIVSPNDAKILIQKKL